MQTRQYGKMKATGTSWISAGIPGPAPFLQGLLPFFIFCHGYSSCWWVQPPTPISYSLLANHSYQIELGQTRKGSKVLGEIYFFRLSLADIIPTSIENAQLINSIARGIGLHDFYQPGLWNFCEGYNDE